MIIPALLSATLAGAEPWRMFLTAKGTADRLTEQPSVPAIQDPGEAEASVYIDSNKQFQTLEGFGAAFTEAAAVTWRKLGPANQQQLLAGYFDPAVGHGYTLCRSHINSCDFALGNYAYTEVAGDTALAHFSIDRDKQALLPMIQAAQKVAGQPLKILASPWSPPAWMKTTGKMNQGGKLKPEFRQAWADYFVRYIQEYRQQGVNIWAVTVQNEPAATQSWDSCIYSAGEERDFVRDFLGPTLHKSGLAAVKITIWDHNRDLMVSRANAAYADPAANQYIWGTAYHWYVEDCFQNVQLLHDAWPDKQLLFTEGCQEGGPHIGEWEPGERYAHSMINDLNRWAVGWIDWNILLDETGGPNHVGNLCSAPVLADIKHDKLLYQSSYYYIGHIAKFFRPGARRILCSTSRDRLEATACRNPDGSVAVVVINRSEAPQNFHILANDQAWPTRLPAHSIATYLSPPHD
jgi:glucosylceramidase